MVADQPEHPHVLEDHAVRSHAGEGRETLHEPGEFPLLDQSVEGDVDLAPEKMGVGSDPLHLRDGEVLGLRPCGKFRQPGVNRISPLLHGGEKGLK